MNDPLALLRAMLVGRHNSWKDSLDRMPEGDLLRDYRPFVQGRVEELGELIRLIDELNSTEETP